MNNSSFRELHKCCYCNRTPNMRVVLKLLDNDKTYYEVDGVAWLLCDLCESYCHFRCYLGHYGLTDVADYAQEWAHYSAHKYVCGPCRQEKNQIGAFSAARTITMVKPSGLPVTSMLPAGGSAISKSATSTSRAPIVESAAGRTPNSPRSHQFPLPDQLSQSAPTDSIEGTSSSWTRAQNRGRFKTIMSGYKSSKDRSSTSGAGRVPKYQFEDRLDELFGDAPNVKPVTTLSSTDDGIPNTPDQDASEDSDEAREDQATARARKPRKQRYSQVTQVLAHLDTIEERQAESERLAVESREKMHREKMSVLRDLIDRLN